MMDVNHPSSVVCSWDDFFFHYIQTLQNLRVIHFVKKWVFPKIVGKPPKWMVYKGSKPYFLMDDLGGFTPYFWFNTQMEHWKLQNAREMIQLANRFTVHSRSPAGCGMMQRPKLMHRMAQFVFSKWI